MSLRWQAFECDIKCNGNMSETKPLRSRMMSESACDEPNAIWADACTHFALSNSETGHSQMACFEKCLCIVICLVRYAVIVCAGLELNVHKLDAISGPFSLASQCNYLWNVIQGKLCTAPAYKCKDLSIIEAAQLQCRQSPYRLLSCALLFLLHCLHFVALSSTTFSA